MRILEGHSHTSVRRSLKNFSHFVMFHVSPSSCFLQELDQLFHVKHDDLIATGGSIEDKLMSDNQAITLRW